MTDIDVQIVDQKIITIPPKLTSIQVEQLGKELVSSGQEGYALTAVAAVTEDRGNQRDPYIVTTAIKLTVKK